MFQKVIVTVLTSERNCASQQNQNAFMNLYRDNSAFDSSQVKVNMHNTICNKHPAACRDAMHFPLRKTVR